MVEVIDGDTLVLEGGIKVRLLGIDAPETGQPFYRESKQYLEQLALGKQVSLEHDAKLKDRYGRLLSYLFLNGTMLNQLMLEDGLARLFLHKRLRYQDRLAAAQRRAVQLGLGLWNHSEWYGCIQILGFDPHKDPALETMIISNRCSKLELTNWYFLNELGSRFELPGIELDQNQMLVIKTGLGSHGELGLNSSRSLGWNQSWVALLDSRGRLVSYLEY